MGNSLDSEIAVAGAVLHTAASLSDTETVDVCVEVAAASLVDYLRDGSILRAYNL